MPARRCEKERRSSHASAISSSAVLQPRRRAGNISAMSATRRCRSSTDRRRKCSGSWASNDALSRRHANIPQRCVPDAFDPETAAMKPWIHNAGMLLAPCIALCACATPASAPAGAQNALTPAEAAAGWQLLFDGNTLDGWRVGENPDSFSVHDGSIVVKGPRAHLFYSGEVEDHDFRDLELKLDVKTYPGANSGVYFHTAWQESGWPAKGYEAQVNNSQSDPSRTAGLYAVDDNLDVPAAD